MIRIRGIKADSLITNHDINSILKIMEQYGLKLKKEGGEK